MSRFLKIVIVLSCFLASCTSIKKDIFIKQKFKTDTGWEIPYNIFYPESYDKTGNKTPVILWLHGSGERGDDNITPFKHVVPYLISKEIQTKYPAIIIVPQCPADGYWSPVNRFEWTTVKDGKITPAMNGVIQLLDKILKDKKIDKSRIYVGGLSMGGFGTYDLLSRRHELFAAAVPICGGADLGKISSYKHIPLWVFHGAKDEVVPVKLSRDVLIMLEKQGVRARYTEYPEGGHDIWNKAIQEPELLPWLFSQRKK
ncbi:MAG: prolyl oligopeptidase family serine peptidase [Saprospiraceae bacterium]|nr:prolyl oligopeptidase family serine peptidase [Saprospiraceae bacterium]